MVTDPGTTPTKPFNQVVFGGGVALHIQSYWHSTLRLDSFALVIVCVLRGFGLYILAAYRVQRVMKLGSRTSTGGAERSGTMTVSIAIVGMACRYPDAGSPAELWESVWHNDERSENT